MSLFLACVALGVGIGIGVCAMLVIANSLTMPGRRKEKRREFIRQVAAKTYIELLKDDTEGLSWEQARSIAVSQAKSLLEEIEEGEGLEK